MNPVTLRVFANVNEADFAASFLRSQGVPVEIANEVTGATYGIPECLPELRVPEADLDRARTLLDENSTRTGSTV